MRIDKLTTKFQEALGEAQSLALANDHQFIEPVHVLLAMLRQDDGPSKALLQRAGANVPALATAAEAAMKKLPQVQGHEQVTVGRDMVSLLQAAEKESMKRGDQFVEVKITLPRIISEETKEVLRQFEKLNPENPRKVMGLE